MMSDGPRARRTASKRVQQISDGAASTDRTSESNGLNGLSSLPSASSASLPAISVPMANGASTMMNNNHSSIAKNSHKRSRLRRKRKTRQEPSTVAIPLTRIKIICVLVFLCAGWLGWIIASSVFMNGSSSYELVSKQRSFAGNSESHSDSNLDDAPFSILVVGGSDGSGTRAFCWALQQLGVVLLVDDKHTMDIEASQLFDRSGWPGFVKYVLQETKGSLDYDWDDLSWEAQKVLKHEVGRFLKHLKLVYENMKIRIAHTQKTQAGVDSNSTIDIPIKSQRIHFAIKAPASMLVLPVLQHVFQQELKFPVAFLHVVRDGRDVSLSQNQSPAQKFYNASFPNDYLQRMEHWKDELYNVRAMQLWNNWNLQVWNNRHHHHHHHPEQGNDQQLPSEQRAYNPKYLLARSEDLVHSKWDVMQALHQFVDSTMPVEDLCCQSHARDKDLGESVHFADTVRHHGPLHPKHHMHKPPHGRHWGGFRGNDGADNVADGGDNVKPLLNLLEWVRESDRALARESQRDPRRALHDAESDSYTLAELMTQGVPLFKRYIEEKQGTMVVKRLEEIVQVGRNKLNTDYKEWKQKFVTRNRAPDAEQQIIYFTRTGNALLDQARSLQHARIALFSRRDEIQTDQTYTRPSDKVVKDIMKDLIQRLHMLEDDGVEHAFTHGQGGGGGGGEAGDGYVDRTVLEKRYGKWQGLLDKKPELSKYLHQEGAEGLENFGYEPYQDFEYPKLDYQCTQEELLQCANSNNNENNGYDIKEASVKLVWEVMEESNNRPILDLSSRDASPEDDTNATNDDGAAKVEWESGQRWRATKDGLIKLGICVDDEMRFLDQCPQLLRLDTDMILETAEWILQEFGGSDYFAKQPSSPKLLSYRLSSVQYGIEFMSTMMMNNAKPFCMGSSDFFQTAIDGGIQEQSVSNALGAAADATYQANQKVAGDAMSSLKSLKNRMTGGL
ncbi:MAG: hypothetical protein SGBAC_007954 [Bacillariaceae sp.]